MVGVMQGPATGLSGAKGEYIMKDENAGDSGVGVSANPGPAPVAQPAKKDWSRVAAIAFGVLVIAVIAYHFLVK
jgi:hypothetical protein